MMATALNMSFKVPVGYFLLPDAFTSEKQAELLRNCIYHVNTTGAVVTNIVMDNCPVNYATFRRLYHLHFLQNQTHNCILYFPSFPKVNFFIRKRHFKNEYLFWTFNIFMHRFYNIYQLFFYSNNLATPAPKPCLLLCLPLPSIKFPHYLCTVIQLLYVTGSEFNLHATSMI